MLQRMFGREEQLFTHPGLSQYSNGGAKSSSACGLAAMNCVRLILSLERQGTQGVQLVDKLSKKETMEEIMSICSQWTSDSHLEVEDISKTPLFQASLRYVRMDYGPVTRSKFEKMLSQLDQDSNAPDNRSSSALVITRPPEIVACLRIIDPSQPLQDVYVIFDSHPRPTHPSGAAFFLSAALERVAQYFVDLFPVGPRLGSDSGSHWQEQLLHQLYGHFFECSNADMRMSRDAEQAFMEANCALLLAKAQECEAHSRVQLLASDNMRLKEGLDHIEKRLNLKRIKHTKPLRHPEQEGSSIPSAVPICTSSGSNSGRHAADFDGSRFQKGSLHLSRPSPARSQSDIKGKGKARDTEGDDDHEIALGLHLECQAARSQSDIKGKGKARETEGDDDHEIALLLHLEYQAEDMNLETQKQRLQVTFAQDAFDCSICMDHLPIDDVARLDGCDHSFCRNCIRQYIVTKLEERRFPLPCPCCSTEKDGGMKGNVTAALIHQIGITEKAYAIFNELQISKFSVPIHCRRCKRGAFADKREFEQTKVIMCPFPNCFYTWCKGCQQEVPPGTDGRIHSCDGSKEFTRLMSQRGWKHCPGCKTPTEKMDGCNHMTCGSPGCNTHFCYTCGGLIVRSSNRSEIDAQVRRHYSSKCSLFPVPAEF